MTSHLSMPMIAPLMALLQTEAPEDGPNLLVRGVPVLLLVCILGGIWLTMRRRRR